MIDCGGGTVDISAFAVVSTEPVRLDQVGKAVGGPWGSTNVDRQFEGYLKVRRVGWHFRRRLQESDTTPAHL